MSRPLQQHQWEIERNRAAWRQKPLLQKIYDGFYERILKLVERGVPGRVVEIGSGIGNLKSRLPGAICTDLFPNPWLDLVCDGYEMPFRDGHLSHLILFDVFHHLRAPNAFLREARRVLNAQGRLILFEPYISWASWPAYACFHHEPVGWGMEIDRRDRLARPRQYHAAQGTATRLFFRKEWPGWPPEWETFHAEAFSSFSYLLSGGFSKPAMYPSGSRQALERCDAWLSRWPRFFGARCLVGLRPIEQRAATFSDGRV